MYAHIASGKRKCSASPKPNYMPSKNLGRGFKVTGSHPCDLHHRQDKKKFCFCGSGTHMHTHSCSHTGMSAYS